MSPSVLVRNVSMLRREMSQGRPSGNNETDSMTSETKPLYIFDYLRDSVICTCDINNRQPIPRWDAEIWECLGVKGLVYLLYHWLAIYNITLYQTVFYQPLPWMGKHGSIMVRDAHFIVTSEGLCYSWLPGKVWLLYLIITLKKYEPIAIVMVRSLNNGMHCVSFCDLSSILSTLARYVYLNSWYFYWLKYNGSSPSFLKVLMLWIQLLRCFYLEHNKTNVHPLLHLTHCNNDTYSSIIYRFVM